MLLTGKRRVFVLVLHDDGDAAPAPARWRGRIKDNPADECRGDTREAVVKQLERLALAQLGHALRASGAPLLREVRFDVEEV